MTILHMHPLLCFVTMKEFSNPTPFYLKSILNPNNTGPCSYCAVPVVPLNSF